MRTHKSARFTAEEIAEYRRKMNDPKEWHVEKERKETHGQSHQERLLKALLYAIYPLATFAFGGVIGWMMHN